MDEALIEGAMVGMDLSFIAGDAKQTVATKENVDSTNVPAKTKPKAKPKAKKGPKKRKSPQSPSKVAEKKKKTTTRKTKKTGGGESEEVLCEVINDYLKKKNRPFNSVTVFQNMNKRLNAAQTKSVLAELVVKDRVKEKSYGKTSVFWINQNQQLKEGDDLEALFLASEVSCKELETEKRKIKGEKETAVERNNAVQAIIDDEALSTRIQHLTETNAKLVESVQQIKVEIPSTSEKVDFGELELQTKFYLRQWGIRRGNLQTILDAISEAQSTKVSMVVEQAGLEDDDALGFPKHAPRSLKDLAVLAKK